MREILFRGFHPCDGPDAIVVDGEKVKGRWVYGAVARFRGLDNALHTDIIPEVDGENIMGEIVNVLPSTVGQYTGLTDQNGKRIFENDVLDVRHGRTDSVIWDSGCFHMENAIMFSELSYGVEGYKVIGTVFDYCGPRGAG